jgi:hypothetical protein
VHWHLSGYKSGPIIKLAALIGAAGLILLPTTARAQQGVVQPGDRSTPAEPAEEDARDHSEQRAGGLDGTLMYRRTSGPMA